MKPTIDQLVEYLKDSGPVILLESQSDGHPAGNISYLAALPVAILKARGSRMTVEQAAGSTSFEANPWDALSGFREEHKGWIFGYLGYDLKNSLEALHSDNPDPVHAPDMYFMVPGLLVKFDHSRNKASVIKGSLPETDSVSAPAVEQFVIDSFSPEIKEEEYIAQICEARRRIGEGDFYEINLSHQMRAACSGESYELYKQMRTVGPVPFGAYLTFDEWSVCSLSPERFLKREGRRVFSQPIKGTIRRGSTASEDAALKDELKASLKNKAENLMIVDLVRNDLSRIAVKNTVSVSELFEVQTFGTVHQMVSTIEAETRLTDPVEIIKACYPMGSMTGAPKISAMKSIEELENYRRGIYSGAIGYIDPGENFDFNVVIRTAIIKGNQLFYSVGGAITGDSDPRAEWEETLVKARAITEADRRLR